MSKIMADMTRLDCVPDPDTDPRLLPGYLVAGDNSRRIRHYKIALRKAMRHLTPCQREHIRLFYGKGLRKSEIAKQHHISCSAVSQSIRAGEKTLRSHIDLYMCIYDGLEREFLLEDTEI